MTQARADVVVIGAGVVGTAIARTLARYGLDLVLVDAAPDVGTGTSKANTAILHTGFDAEPGTLESRLLQPGQRPAAFVRRGGRHPGGAHRRAARRLDTRTGGGPAGHLGERPAERVPGRAAAAGRRALRAANRGWDRVRSGRWRSRTRASSVPGPHRSPSRPRRSGAGVRLRARAAGDGRGSGRRFAISSTRRAGRCGAGGWSTRPGWAATRSTGCSAATGSPSGRGAAS